MKDYELPELPSDEELGIAGLDGEELPGSRRPSDPAQPLAKRGAPARPRASAPPAAVGTWLRGLLAFAVLVGGVWAASEKRALPRTVPANVPDTVFSSGRAMAQLVEMARAPRPVGSPEHARVREMIMARLAELGLEPVLHETESVRRSAQTVRAVALRNIVARIPGTASSGAIVLTSHYDGVPLSHAAGDAGVGVVTVLETIRALQAGPPLANDVIVLITDGEELGLLGARAFVEEHPWVDDVRVVLSVEMRGGGGPSHMFETGAQNGWIVRAMRAGDPRPFASSLSVEIYRRMPNDTDFTPFREAGIQGLNFAAIDRAHIYHQPTDVPQNVSESTLQHHGMRVLGITRELGGRDLSAVHAPDVVYEVVPFLGHLLIYPERWAVAVSVGILLLWMAVTLLAAARGPPWTAMLAGLALMLVAGLVAAAAGWALQSQLARFHAEYGSMTPLVYGESWYLLGLTAAVAAVMLALFTMARRRFSLVGLAVAATFPMVASALALAVAAPLGALVLQGPALAGVLALGVAVVATSPLEEPGAAGAPSSAAASLPTLAWLLALGLALPALGFMVPLTEATLQAMSLRHGAALGVLLVLAIGCILPALEGLRQPNRWWAPAVAAGLALLFLGVGILRARPSADRPLHSTLVYTLDRESGLARWATRDDPGQGWAEGRVGSFAAVDSLTAFLVPTAYRTAPAPAIDAPAPTVVLRSGTVEEGRRMIRVAVASQIGAELVHVLVPEGAGAVLVGLNRRPLPLADEGSVGARRPVTRITHQGVPHEELTFDFEVVDRAEAVPIAVIEEHLRAAELVGPEAFRRPAHLVPNPLTRSDRALIRTVVTLDLAPDAAQPIEPGADPAAQPTDAAVPVVEPTEFDADTAASP